jgi:hypothetical protein
MPTLYNLGLQLGSLKQMGARDWNRIYLMRLPWTLPSQLGAQLLREQCTTWTGATGIESTYKLWQADWQHEVFTSKRMALHTMAHLGAYISCCCLGFANGQARCMAHGRHDRRDPCLTANAYSATLLHSTSG